MYIKMAKYNQQRGLRQIIRLIVRDRKLVPFKALGFKIMENHEQANSTIASVYMRKKLTLCTCQELITALAHTLIFSP